MQRATLGTDGSTGITFEVPRKKLVGGSYFSSPATTTPKPSLGLPQDRLKWICIGAADEPRAAERLSGGVFDRTRHSRKRHVATSIMKANQPYCVSAA